MRRTIRRLGPILGLILSITLFEEMASAQFTWNGGGGDAPGNKWSNNANWQGGTAPTTGSTTDIVFGGVQPPSLISDVDSAFEIRTLTFNSTAGSFVLTDSQLTVDGGGITNSSANLQTISNAIVVNAPQTWNAAAGDITFTSTVSTAGNLLTITGGHNIEIQGQMTGTGGLTKNGAGTLTLDSGLNGGVGGTFTGPVILNAGTLTTNGTDNALPFSAYTVNGGTLNANGSDVRMSSLTQASGAITLGSNSSAITDTGVFTQSGGTFTLAGGTGTFTT
jgi:hypothetical protein